MRILAHRYNSIKEYYCVKPDCHRLQCEKGLCQVLSGGLKIDQGDHKKTAASHTLTRCSKNH